MNSLTYYVSRQEAEEMDRAFELYSFLAEDGGFYTQMFIPQNINFLLTAFNARIDEINEEIVAHEKNNDAAYADQARKKQKQFEALRSKYQTLVPVEE